MSENESRLTIIVLILLIITSSLFLCDAPTESETTGDIQGIIYDASNSEPLRGAEITTNPKTSSKITDSDGSYKIEGVEPSEYTVNATKSDYQSNSTTVNVVAGEISSADLQLSPIEPELSVSTNTLDFGTSTTSKPINISNSGQSTLEWTASENSDWIEVSPNSGSITSDQSSILVSIDRSNVDPGEYEDSIVISSNGGSATINVCMTVEGPVLVTSNKSLNFGTASDNLTFNLTNGGVGTVNYNATFSAEWLSVNPSSGSITTETDVINVNVNREGLDYGNYFETITFTSNANSVKIDIMMTVPDPDNPQLSAFPTELNFSSNETEMSFYIENTGSGTLSWNLSDNKPWISYDNQSGETSTENDEIIVKVDRLSLDPGNYNGTVEISSDGGNQNINITMTVPNEPSLSVSPNYLDFGSDKANLTFDIANSGTGELNWSISDNQEWITINPESGTNFNTINVNVNRSDKSPGDYSGSATISSNGGTGYVEISMNVPEDTPPSEIELQTPTDITKNSLKLIWTRNFDSDFAAYKIYRDTDASVDRNSELIETITESSNNSYADTGLQPSTTYYYRVYTMDMADQYTASNVVGATTLSELGSWSVIATLDNDLNAIDVLNENYVVTVGKNGSIYYYVGSEWTEESSPTTNSLYDVKINSKTDIWAVGADGIFHYNGIKWYQSYESSYQEILTIDALDTNKVWAGGEYGVIYYYNGVEWSKISLDADEIRDIQIDDKENGWAVDALSRVFYYNGHGWSMQHDCYNCETNTHNGYGAECITAVNTSNIWIGLNIMTELIHWDGQSWKSNYIEDSYSDIYSISAISSYEIWFVGGFSDLGSKIYFYNGDDMREISSPIEGAIYDIVMLSSGSGWAIGYGGSVLRYH